MSNPYVKQTWTDGVSSASAARMTVMEQGIFDAHIQPAARVTHSANQATVTSTPITLAFNTEIFDQDGLGGSTIHDTVTNNSRLTCKVAGIYLITANIEWGASASGYRSVQILQNGASLVAEDIRTATGSGTSEIQIVTAIYSLAVNDYVEVKVNQASGGALNVTATTGRSPIFSMVRVG